MITAEEILKIIAGVFKMEISLFLKKSRNQKLIGLKHCGAYFLRKHTSLLLSEIGEMLGVIDHSTVIHGIKKVADLISVNDAEIIAKTTEINDLIKKRLGEIEQGKLDEIKRLDTIAKERVAKRDADNNRIAVALEIAKGKSEICQLSEHIMAYKLAKYIPEEREDLTVGDIKRKK
jgi:hypothetical protein